MTPPTTLFEKLWQQHLVAAPSGEPSILYIDLHLVHEVTSPQAFDGLRMAGRKLRRPDRTIATVDHNVPTSSVQDRLHILDPIAARQVDALRRNCTDFGVQLYDVQDASQGIVHMIGPELGATKPGMTIVCGDSHTSTHGAFGALAFGIGTSEVEHVMATQTLPQDKPRTFRITVDGDLPFGVTAKDIILDIIGRIGTAGATGHVVEYAGTTIRALSMEGRMTICNMSIEAGARAGMIAPDATTFAYLRGRRFSPSTEPGAQSLDSEPRGHIATSISDLVLAIVSDDYESLGHIEKQIRDRRATSNKQPGKAEIESVLCSLIERELVSAFLLDPGESQAKQTLATSKPMSELWFYATEEGRYTVRSLAGGADPSNKVALPSSLWDQAVAHWSQFVTDEGATFDRELTLQAEDITPTVSWGTSPGMVTGIKSTVPLPNPNATEADQKNFERALEYMDLKPGTPMEQIKIDAVFLGSCTNARIEDLRAAAAVVTGHHVATTVRAMVVPGSQSVKRQAEQEGLDQIFKTAGFDWREPGCSMCLGMNPDILAPGERCASTSNRNFEGRQGRGGRTHLVSPVMAAAAAITGHFTDIRTWKFKES